MNKIKEINMGDAKVEIYENKAIIELYDKKFEIRGKYDGEIYGFPNTDDNLMHNVFRIRIKRIDIQGKPSITFKFYDSYANYEKGKTELDGKDLIFAFQCFLSDAYAGTLSFEEFCKEYGYNEDSRKAEKIHKECIKQLEKAYRLGIFGSEITDYINMLNEIEEEI